MNLRYLLFSSSICVASLSLIGCDGEKKQAEIDKLTQELEQVSEELASKRKRLESEGEKKSDLAEENRELKSELHTLKRRAESAERDLERLKERELAAKKVREREPSSREKLEAAKKAVAGHLASVVAITGDKTSGSGTLVSADDKIWIYFSASSVAGNSRLEIVTSDGKKLSKFGTFEVASDADLVRLELKDKVEGVLNSVGSTEMESGSSMLGIGESDAIIEGRASDVTAEKINAVSRFNKAAAGTPVFTVEKAELLGIIIASGNEERSLWPKRASSYEPREVCRLDRAIKWVSVPIATFMEEAKSLAEADEFTRLVFAFAATSPSSAGIGMSSQAGPSMTASEILERNKQLAAVRSLFEVDEWLKERGERAAKADLNRRISGVYDDLLRISTRSTAKLAAAKLSPFHAKAAAQSLEWRKESEKKLSDLTKSIE